MQGSNARFDQIIVIASDLIEQQLIDTALKPLCDELCFADSACEVHSKIDKSTAIIICHQISVETPKPELPAIHGHERVMVLSNCMVEECIVEIIQQGAHHYFDIKESTKLLHARLKAALRQHHSLQEKISFFAPYRFCMSGRRVEMNGKVIHLNPREFDCAHYLFTHHERVVKTEELMVSVWALPPAVDSRRIDTATCRLRKKLGLDTSKSGWLLTRVRGTGYELTKLA